MSARNSFFFTLSRTTFRLSERTINVVSIVASHLGIRQKSLFDHLMEDMATGEIRLSILWEWLHKGAKLTEDDPETDVYEGDVFTTDLFDRLLVEEYENNRHASACS